MRSYVAWCAKCGAYVASRDVGQTRCSHLTLLKKPCRREATRQGAYNLRRLERGWPAKAGLRWGEEGLCIEEIAKLYPRTRLRGKTSLAESIAAQQLFIDNSDPALPSLTFEVAPGAGAGFVPTGDEIQEFEVQEELCDEDPFGVANGSLDEA